MTRPWPAPVAVRLVRAVPQAPAPSSPPKHPAYPVHRCFKKLRCRARPTVAFVRCGNIFLASQPYVELRKHHELMRSSQRPRPPPQRQPPRRPQRRTPLRGQDPFRLPLQRPGHEEWPLPHARRGHPKPHGRGPRPHRRHAISLIPSASRSASRAYGIVQVTRRPEESRSGPAYPRDLDDPVHGMAPSPTLCGRTPTEARVFASPFPTGMPRQGNPVNNIECLPP